jgi:hypothetical protein
LKPFSSSMLEDASGSVGTAASEALESKHTKETINDDTKVTRLILRSIFSSLHPPANFKRHPPNIIPWVRD